MLGFQLRCSMLKGLPGAGLSFGSDNGAAAKDQGVRAAKWRIQESCKTTSLLDLPSKNRMSFPSLHVRHGTKQRMSWRLLAPAK